MRKDKWYKPFYKMHVLDKKAAEAMDVTFPEDTPNTIKDFTAPKASVAKDTFLAMEAKPRHTLELKYWNYPQLIEDLEDLHKVPFARADVKNYLAFFKLTLKKAVESISLVEILLRPKSEGQKIIRSYWLRDLNKVEILAYLGVDRELLDFLEEYTTEDFTGLGDDLPKLPDLENHVTYRPATLTDQARQGKFHRYN
jgi:hypothetical protein